METKVIDNEAAGRYEIHADGALAGFVKYRVAEGVVSFTHTEIDSAFEGRGLGSTLVRGALDGARARGQKVEPLCPFVRRYIDRHAEYKSDLA